MQQQEQQFNASSANHENFLQDLSQVDASLNETYAKPMLQNPIGLNQSYVANLSNNDASKSKLDASMNRYPYIELGQKQREAQQEYYELNPNHSYQNDNLKVRPIALSKGALSDVTDDTKDLSQMSLHHLKGNIYSQNNSYYLNNSTLQDPNRTKKHDSIMAKAADLSQKMDQHLKIKSHDNSINIVDNFVPVDNEIRHTANFGKNPYSSQQPADLLSYVNSGADLNNSKLAKPSITSSEQSNIFNNPIWTRQSEVMNRSTQGIIPKESRGMTKGAAKEIEVILEGLETLELSKISSLSENFLEDEEENQAKEKKAQPPPPQTENNKGSSSPNVKPTMSFTENLAQKILADVKKNLDRPPALKIESQYSSNTRAESQYNSNYLTQNNTKADPQDFTLGNNKNFFSAQLASPTNNSSNILSNYQTNFTSIVPAPKIQTSEAALNQEDLTKRLTQIQTASPTKNSEQSTYRNLSIHSGLKFSTLQFDSYRGPKTATNKESMTPEVPNPEAYLLSNYKSVDRTPTSTTPNSNFRTPQRAAIMEASQMMERMQSLYKEFKDKNTELNDYVQELTQPPSLEHTNRASNSTIPKNSVGNNSGMRFSDHIDHHNNRQVRQTTHGFLEKKARFSSYSKSPFDMRYSVRDPNTFDALPNEAAAMRTENNYQEFIKEDLLKDLDSPTHSKFNMQSKLKTFSNPVFKKPSISSMSRDSTTPIPERLSQSKRDYHQESMNLIDRIFDTPARPVKTEERSTTPYEKKILHQSQGPLEARSQNITTAASITVVENKSNIFDKPKSERPKVNHRTRRNLSSIFEDEVNVSIGGDEGTNVHLPVINYRSNKNLFNHTLFGFNVKQEKFIEGKGERKIQTDNMEIICINCQEFIKISKVDKHSQTCDKSRQQPEEDQNRSIHHNISELNVKLFGIKDRIKHKSTSLGSKGACIVEILNQITKLVDKIIDENDSDIKLLGLIRQVEINLDQLSSHHLVEQDLGLLIYVNRILVLSQEKFNELEESEEDLTTLEDQIRAVQRETLRQKAELEVWQHQAKMMNQIKQSDDKNMKYVKKQYKKDNEVLSQIHSDIEASEKESSHGGTTETSGSGAISQVNFVAFKTAKENAQSENNKVKFYSLAVNIKLTLPSTHKGKDVLISDLYDVCLAEKVPEKEWDTFIRNKLMS